MCRQAAANTKIIGRADQPGSEVILPDPVDDHAAGQRVVLGHDPAGQGNATPTGELVSRLEGRLLFDQGRRHRSGHLDARLVRVAPFQQVCHRGSRRGFEEEVALWLRLQVLAGQLHRRQCRPGQLGPPFVLALQPSKDGNHRVVIPGRQGVELVVVASRTTHRQSQEDLGGGTDHVVQLVEQLGNHLAFLDTRASLGVPWSHPVKPGGQDRFGCRTGDLVPGQLFGHEPVVGPIGIECSDHPVPVLPGQWLDPVNFVPVRVGVSHQVQPVTPPAFAVVRVGQQPVNHPCEGGGSPIGHKTVNHLRRWRQAEQIE